MWKGSQRANPRIEPQVRLPRPTGGECVLQRFEVMKCVENTARWNEPKVVVGTHQDRSRTRSGNASTAPSFVGSLLVMRATNLLRTSAVASAVAVLTSICACEPVSGGGTQPPAAPTTPTASTAPSPPAKTLATDHSAALALPSLAERMKAYFSVGVAVEPKQLDEQGDIIAHHFNRLVAENAMKFIRTCATPTCDYASADKIATYAREHGMQMTGHTFVWHQMFPDWLFKDGDAPAKAEVVSERLRKQVFSMTERYADVVDNWDVVNEAISDSPDKTYRDASEGSKWAEAFGGGGYVKAAFQHAAAAAEKYDPTVKLYYNDYNVAQAAKRKKIIEMVRALRAEGVRVDGVGLQAHWNIETPTIDEIRAAIDELAAEKLLVKVSELDISVYPKDDWGAKKWQPAREYTPELAQQLADRYAAIFKLFIEKAAVVEHVTFWGVSDDQTWLNQFPTVRPNFPLLFDRQNQPKLALKALVEL